MNEAEEFLKKRTGRCERLRMWLTPEGCAAIRSRGSGSWAYEDTVAGPPTQCADCPGVEVQPDAYQAPASAALAPQKTHNVKTGGEIVTEQTYTVGELAALLGVPPKDIANARQYRNALSRPGTKNHTVRDGMAARGITWEQVVTGPRGKSADTAPVSAIPHPAKESASPAPVIESASDAPENDLSDAVADMEPEDTPLSLPAAGALPLGRAIARELYTCELEEDAAKRLSGSGPVPGSIGEAMSLEDILGELRRRLPGAAITIALQ